MVEQRVTTTYFLPAGQNVRDEMKSRDHCLHFILALLALSSGTLGATILAIREGPFIALRGLLQY